MTRDYLYLIGTALIIVHFGTGCPGPEPGWIDNSCADGEMSCGDGSCIPDAWRCDGEQDCDNGRDEESCSSDGPSESDPVDRPEGESLCTDTCEYAGDGECDDGGPSSSYDICELGTDCTDCGARTGGQDRPDAPSGCGADEITCANGNCVASSSACNGTDDCGDGSDEAAMRCDVPEGLTFVGTAVSDDLDQADLDIFAEQMSGIGFRQATLDRDVSTSELAEYLRMDVTTLYHTGHGEVGIVYTSDGELTVDTTTIGARNVIWATCLTLDESWANAFGPNTETVLGYTKVSFDGVDEDVVRSFASQLANGQSHMEAWYLSNSAISDLADRWAGYVREGSSIVEYSARRGNRPAGRMRTSADMVEIGSVRGLFVSEEILADERTMAESFSRDLVVASAEVTATMESQGLAHLDATERSADEAIASAEAWLRENGGLPADAVLDRVIPIDARQNGSGRPVAVAHMVRFAREVEGVRVRGNRVEDHIAVLVGADSVLSVSRYWPETAVTESSPREERLLGVGAATRLAADDLSASLKGGELHIIAVTPVYGTLGLGADSHELVPAYELRGRDGSTIVISAVTGEIL